jgi:toxin-antitoxin system PIN domain toxin
VTPDVNVLVAAFRGDHEHHTEAQRALADALHAAAAGTPLTLLPMVLAGFLRLVTNERVFVTPAPIDVALTFVDTLRSARGVAVAAVGDEWAEFRRLCLEKALKANQLPDAWIAAAVIHLGEHLLTFDRDFAKLLTRNQYTRLPKR